MSESQPLPYGLPAPQDGGPNPNSLPGPIFPPGHPFSFRQESPQQAELTVILQAYFRPVADEAVVSDGRWVRQLGTTEQPYGPRRMTVDEQWRPLDLGWIKDCSMLFIENLEGVWTQVQPSQWERDDAAKRIVEVKQADAVYGWLIRPQASFLAEPSFVDGIHVRCHHGKARINVTAYPG